MRSERAFVGYLAVSLIAMGGTATLLCYAGHVIVSSAPGAAKEPYWEMMQGVCAVAATSWIVGSATFALAQYRRSLQERHLAIFNDLFAALMSEPQIVARRWIYSCEALTTTASEAEIEQFVNGLSLDDQSKIKLTLNSLDHLGFLVDCDWLNDDKVLGWLSPIVSKTWQRLAPLIQFERRRRQDPGYYWHCEALASRCRQLNKRSAGRFLPKRPEDFGDTVWLDKTL